MVNIVVRISESTVKQCFLCFFVEPKVLRKNIEEDYRVEIESKIQGQSNHCYKQIR